MLVNNNSEYTRTVHDNFGRVIQQISNEDYDVAKEGLPDFTVYSDSQAGHLYTYADNGNLANERNRYGIYTYYYYSEIGTLSHKQLDIYDYYFHTDGTCDKIDVSGVTVIECAYDAECTYNSLKGTYDQITYD